MHNFERFSDVIEESMDAMIAAGSFNEIGTTVNKERLIGSQVIASLAAVFFE
jgi:hypothetical protein